MYHQTFAPLTHLPLVPPVFNRVSIGSGNGLLPVWRQATTWTNTSLLSIEPLGINFSAIRVAIKIFLLIKIHLKVSSAKWRPFCPGRDELSNRTSAGLVMIKFQSLLCYHLIQHRIWALFELKACTNLFRFSLPVTVRSCQRFWWHHQMETFFVSLALCAGNFTGEFPSQRPVTRSFDVFFDLRWNKQLSKQSWRW